MYMYKPQKSPRIWIDIRPNTFLQALQLYVGKPTNLFSVLNFSHFHDQGNVEVTVSICW
jgi:hypothetical protein